MNTNLSQLLPMQYYIAHWTGMLAHKCWAGQAGTTATVAQASVVNQSSILAPVSVLAQTSDSAAYDATVESLLRSGWSLPHWFVLVFAGLAAGFCWWIYRSERGPARVGLRIGLAAIRFALLITVLWMLAGWTWVQFKTQRPEVAVVVDVSASMATTDMNGSSDNSISRLDAVKEVLRPLSGAEGRTLENYQVSWYSAATSLERISSLSSSRNLEELQAEGAHSRLGECLTKVLERQAGQGTAAIVFLSDGINTAGPGLGDVENLARSAAIPVHTAVFGREFALPDIRLADLLMEKNVYFGDRVTAEVSVIASDIANQSVTVTLSDAQSKRRLDETQLSLSSESNQKTARLSFIPDRPGEIELLLNVSTADNETELANNSMNVAVNVQDESIRVLLVQDKPSYEFRFLKHFLERSRQVGDETRSSFILESVLQEADPVYVAQDKSAIRLVPSDLEAIQDFDVFVFGDFEPSLVSRKSQQAIVESVTEVGAGCMFICGSGNRLDSLRGWPLGELLPVSDEGVRDGGFSEPTRLFRWQLTPLGSQALPMQLLESPAQNSRLWVELPAFGVTCEVGTPRVGAQILANAVNPVSETPALITQYAGAGRTALQAMDETYRWTSYGGTDLFYQRYWGQMLRWLSQGKLRQDIEESELRIDPPQAKFGRPIRMEATLGKEIQERQLPDSVEVILEGPGARSTTVRLPRIQANSRVYQNVASDLPPGQYRAFVSRPVTTSQPNAEFVITSPPGEQANLRANAEGLRSLAERSRGKFYLAEEAQRLFAELPPGTPTVLGTLPPVPVWNHPLVALWFVSLITAEWLLRRAARML